MIASDPELFSTCGRIICAECGPIDLMSAVLPWEITDYYRDEMGNDLFRKFFFLKDLIDPGVLSSVKLMTNRIEERFSRSTSSGTARQINIDPGYVTEAKVVLASTKDFSHRVYIGQGVYAEVTLRYSSSARTFTVLEHTYFDFRTDAYRDLFTEARDILRKQLGR